MSVLLDKHDKKAAFAEFVSRNWGKIRRVSEANTVRNSKGEVVVTKDDPWREEHTWDHYAEKSKK